MPGFRARTAPTFLLSLGCAYALIAIVSGPLFLWETGGLQLAASARSGLFTAAILIGFGLLLARQLRAPIELSLSAFATALAFLICTDWTTHAYSFFQGPTIRGEILLGLFAAAWILHSKRWSILAWALPVSVAIVAWSFWSTTAGRLIFADDHPSFLYRLYALKSEFPHIPFYYPGWNAGLDARDFFATGALAPFLLFYPLVMLFEPSTIYNVIVTLILCGLVPASTYAAARLMALPHLSACIAALLALTSSLNWYKWSLKYGTMGFVVSMSLLPLVIALAGRFLAKDELSKRDAIGLVITGTLCLLWPGSFIALLPVVAIGFISIRLVFQSRVRQRVLIALILLNLPWMVTFATVSKVGAFIESTPVAHQEPAEATISENAIKEHPRAITVERVLRNLRVAAVSANPLILLLAIPGIALLRPPYRPLFMVLTPWLLALGSALTFLRPQLELERMLVTLTLLAALPTAQALAVLLDRYQRGMALAFAPVICIACMLTGPFAVAGIVHNRSLEQYQVAAPIVQNLTDAIRTRGGSGRTVFSGFMLHELSGGHIAPLSFKTGKPLVASSPFHNAWRYEQVVPKSFIDRGDAGIIEFLDLMNATLVVAHEDTWRKYFLGSPNLYEKVWQEGGFSLFTRPHYTPSYFLKGQGEIESSTRAISVTLQSADATLKFRWFPFLRASECSLYPVPVAPELTLIGLKDCPIGVPVTITAAPALMRVLQTYGLG